MYLGPRTIDPIAWRPTASIDVIRRRARLLADIREFFRDAGVLEVETPIASVYANTDPGLESLTTGYVGPGFPAGLNLYLQTSPEFAMKRLLAAGSGPIYQICKVFRDSERGRLHNPEFTLLEWYRPGLDYHQLMDEVAALVQMALGNTMRQERTTYADLFRSQLELDPHRAGIQELSDCAVAQGVAPHSAAALSRDDWLNLLLTHCIESDLGRGCLTFVHDYPPSQAALARVRSGPCPVAERFELYLEGQELANGFQELTDVAAQRSRFEADLVQRAGKGQAIPPMDERLLAALQAGLPECAGVALGLDRLLMLPTSARHIDQVLAFPLERA
jgi:lysyl-tRNA synthetase class 2